MFEIPSGIGRVGRDDGFNVGLEGKSVITEKISEGPLVTNSIKHPETLTVIAGVAYSDRRRVVSYEGQRDAKLGSVAVEQSCRNFENRPSVRSGRLGSTALIKPIATY